MERLDKAVATFGNIPRSEAVKRIRRGEVTVDGTVCRDPASKWDPTAHTLAVAGRVLDSRPHRYFMLNKPGGFSVSPGTRKPPPWWICSPPNGSGEGSSPPGGWTRTP